MDIQNPVLSPNAQLPAQGQEGQVAFVSGIGLHQFVLGAWVLLSQGEAVTPVVGNYPLAQKQVSTTLTTLFAAPNPDRTLTEVTIVTGEVGGLVTLSIVSSGTTYNILKNCFLDAYLTTIIDLKIPLATADQVVAQVLEGSPATITLTGAIKGTETLIVKTNVNGAATLYTAPSNKTITNLILCNNAGVTTTTTMNIRRSGSQEADSTFFNELQTAAGEVVLGDITTAIDTGSTITIDTDQQVSVFITA